jgi:glycine cleavage system regulatory protein
LRLGGKAPLLVHSILLVFILMACAIAASRFARVGSWEFLLLLLLFNALAIATLRVAFGSLEKRNGAN